LKNDKFYYLKDESSFNMSKDKPTKIARTKKQKPTCIGGHTDHIVPIIYGMPTEEMMRKAELGLVHVGGCVMSDSDPKFYCTSHETEL